MGKTKLPAAVPDTQIPLARARRLLKYIETMIMPGVVLSPPPMPTNIVNDDISVEKFIFTQKKKKKEEMHIVQSIIPVSMPNVKRRW